ncbi:hypothetical protein PY365_15900 [Roseiarcaceae bacterium H3SJ34-1]|uniref:hypothetical protein n=1 Tax=Terripilifer ovatus TaxID=3032367 RepID=UPI003AB957EA|nr:hypothetical protein [Roseiarcaceae bacterium H3SJ34-1]
MIEVFKASCSLHPAAVAYAALDLRGPHRFFGGAWWCDRKAEPPAGFGNRFLSLGAGQVLAGWNAVFVKKPATQQATWQRQRKL